MHRTAVLLWCMAEPAAPALHQPDGWQAAQPYTATQLLPHTHPQNHLVAASPASACPPAGKEKREKMAIMETAISSLLSHPNVVQTYTYSVEPVMGNAKSMPNKSGASISLHDSTLSVQVGPGHLVLVELLSCSGSR